MVLGLLVSVVTGAFGDANGNRQRDPGEDYRTYTYTLTGARETEEREIGGERVVNRYKCDAEDRLSGIEGGTVTTGDQYEYAYTYDYRTRRVVRDESRAGGERTRLTYAGGTSFAEYAGENTTPEVYFVRGSDYGGGVGGILYSVREAAPVQLDQLSMASYESPGSPQDVGGDNFAFAQGGYELQLTGDSWKALAYQSEITAETVLEVEIRSDAGGEVLAVGVDEDTDPNSLAKTAKFQIGGTQTLSAPYWLQDYNDYIAGSGWKRYSLPVGDHVTGTINQLVFVSDQDDASSAEIMVRNLRLYESDVSSGPSYAHFNSRGDVIARTDATGTITYLAGYEAFGRHGDTASSSEWGTNPDRQQANTKEEDPTGLLNEGFRYRDLVTGTFLTRDPLGFVDGPNLYAYVVQNPWTKFDPLGLSWKRRLQALGDLSRLGKKYNEALGRAQDTLLRQMKGGQWKGAKMPTPKLKGGGNIEAGRSYSIDDLAKSDSLGGRYKGKSISYNKDGFPEYGDFVQKINGKDARVEIEFSQKKGAKGRKADNRAADKELGIDSKFREENGLVWHHREDMKTMELVPADLHGATSHVGGRAMFEEAMQQGLIPSTAGLVGAALFPNTAEAEGFWGTIGGGVMDAVQWVDPGFQDAWDIGTGTGEFIYENVLEGDEE